MNPKNIPQVVLSDKADKRRKLDNLVRHYQAAGHSKKTARMKAKNNLRFGKI